MHLLIQILQGLFLLYFAAMNLCYLALNVISFVVLSRYKQKQVINSLPQIYSGFEPPISVLVPAHNEEATIAGSIHSLLQLSYSQFEIIVINDGSKDKTLEVLIKEFSLVVFPEAFRVRVKSQPVKAVYHSTVYPELRVIDKANGGKADALNAGINGSHYPLFCGLDADSILQRDSLERVVEPFLEDPRTVASGGIIRIANGCQVSGGFLLRAGLPRKFLAQAQIIEYLRAFLFGRLGWTPMNALLVISGAFGLFHKETVIEAGGYRSDTVGEDMELVVRLHRKLRLLGKPYRITFIPDSICWTEAPEDLRTLKNQRMRWQRGLSDSLAMNLGLLLNRRGGAAGWVAFPFMLLFEWLSPVVEVAGYLYFIIAFCSGTLSLSFAIMFLVVTIGFGLVLSVGALILEEMSFHTYPKIRHLLMLFLITIAENFGYRQLTAVWRLMGLVRWILRSEAKWGEMTRTASWQHDQVQTAPSK